MNNNVREIDEVNIGGGWYSLTFIRKDGTIGPPNDKVPNLPTWYNVDRYKYIYLPYISDRMVPCWNLYTLDSEHSATLRRYREQSGVFIDDGTTLIYPEEHRWNH